MKKYQKQIIEFVKNAVMDQNPIGAKKTIVNILRNKIDDKFNRSLKQQEQSTNK